MLLLTATTDKLRLVTSAAATVDVHASFVDASNAVPPVVQGDSMGRQNTAITTATTTDIVAAPGASDVRNVKELHVRNKHASLACVVTVTFDQNGTAFELYKVTLQAGESLKYVDGVGFFKVAADSSLLALPSGSATTAVIAAHSADTYYLGMPVSPSGVSRLRAGSFFRWVFGVVKAAGGTAAPTFNIRHATGGVVGDASRCLVTLAAQTAVVDRGYIVVDASFRSVGAAAIIVGRVTLLHELATTGLNVVTTGMQQAQTVGGSYNSDITDGILGLSVNPGAAAAWVVESVLLDAVNLVY